MKITKRQLRRIIKEEKAKVLAEQTTGADRAIGLYFDMKHQQMAFDSLSVLFDESVADAMSMDGMMEEEAVDAVTAGLRKLFNEWLYKTAGR